MRHHNHNRKLGRPKGQRVALLRSLARSLVIHGKIVTTETRAREVRPMIEKLVTRSKNATLANRRILISTLGDNTTASKLIKTAETYKERAGGYTRIVKMVPRAGDASPMAQIEFV
jgi:large subunit ribosomal protein L17